HGGAEIGTVTLPVAACIALGGALRYDAAGLVGSGG
ncbi:MAG: hypothetical protein RLY78_1529, partial [Pseudomonadota bacterium]